MGIDVLVLQHGEKVRTSGDPGLTELGRQQAAQVALWLKAQMQVEAVWASPLRRAQETARAVAEAFGHHIRTDPRLTERMNWDGEDVLSLDDFLSEWQRASEDRSYDPRVGDSSAEAGDRFIEALCEIASSAPDGSAVVVVAHGGVTVDALRTLLGDEVLAERKPDLISDGVPCCAITRFHVDGGAVAVTALPLVDRRLRGLSAPTS